MKKMKRLFTGCLALVMLLSLAACGKKNEAETPGTTPAPEYVYVAEFKELQSDSESSLWPIVFTEEGFYANAYEKVGEQVPEGETPQYEGQYDVYENRYYFVRYDGTITCLENFTEIETMEDTGEYQLFSAGSSVYGLFEQADGTLLSLENAYVSYYDGPEGLSQQDEEFWRYFVSEYNYYLRRLDKDGGEISRMALDLGDKVYLNGSNAMTDENGSLVMSYNDEIGKWGLIALTPEGGVVYQVSCDGYVDNLIRLKDGRLAATSWGERGQELKAIDSATGKFTDSFEIPDDAYNLIPGNGAYDFYYTSGVKLYGFDLETGEKTMILDWISCDVDSSDMNKVYVGADGTISGLLYGWRRSGLNAMIATTMELVQLKQVPYESVPQKAHLTLAVQYVDYNLRRAVIDFNRKNDKVRIDVLDYSEYNTEEDWSAGQTKLTTEISAGNLPDILCLDGMPYTQLAGKGLLEDLYPYIDADKDLDRSDVFENILRAQEIEGGLYQVTSNFQLTTVVGPKELVGDRTGWTYRDVLDVMKDMPADCEIFGYGTTKDQILSQCLSISMDSFVDWASGKCTFDSQEFLDALEFANQFPLEANYENYDYTVDSDRARISRGQQLLMSTYLYNFTDFQEYDYYFGGTGSTAYIGYPTSDGSAGSALLLGTGYAMSAKCADKEAAWSFLRQFLTGEQLSYGMPVNRKAFDEMMAEAMQADYQTDMDGNFILDENGEKIEISHMSIGFGDGNMIEIYAMTQEQADQLMALIESTTKVIDQGDQVTQMVLEEAAAYFNGQKSAQEVARLIQSKVNIYVNEQK